MRTLKNILSLLAVIALLPVYLAVGLWIILDGRWQRARSRHSRGPNR
jgi:hypothetical protein